MKVLEWTMPWMFVAVLGAPGVARQTTDTDRGPTNNLPGTLDPVVHGPLFALGTHVAGPFDVETPTGDTGCVGVARGWGFFWVSARKLPAGSPHEIHKFSSAGALLATYQQAGSSATSGFGLRDLAVDEVHNKLYGGFEGARFQEYDYNPTTGGLSFVAEYLVSGMPTTTVIRALARNPVNGHFFTKDFTSKLREFTVSGTSATVIASQFGNGKTCYGLAWDPINNLLWSFDQNNPSGGVPGCTVTGGGNGDLVEFNAVNPADGQLLGPTFLGVQYGVTCTNLAGGCDIFDDGSGSLKIVGLHQNTTDELNVYDLNVPVSPPAVVYCTPSSTTNGCHPTMGYSGTPSASASSGFTLLCTNLEGQKSGIQFYGISGQLIQPWATGSSSFLCMKTPTQRMITQSTGGTANQCNGSVSTDFLAFVAANPGSLGTPLMAGQVVDAQTWFRDPPAPKTTNLSDGLEFTLAP